MTKRKGENMPITKYSQRLRKQLLKEYQEFIAKEDYPSILKFAATKRIPKSNFFDWPEFADSLKIARDICENWLNEKLLSDPKNPVSYIFKLKAGFGYRDNTEVTPPKSKASVTVSASTPEEALNMMDQLTQATKQANTKRRKRSGKK